MSILPEGISPRLADAPHAHLPLKVRVLPNFPDISKRVVSPRSLVFSRHHAASAVGLATLAGERIPVAPISTWSPARRAGAPDWRRARIVARGFLQGAATSLTCY